MPQHQWKNSIFSFKIIESTQIIQQKFFTLSHLSSERATGLARFVNLIGSWSPDHTYTARVRKRCPWEEEKKTTPRARTMQRPKKCACCCCCCLCGKKKTRKTRHIPQLHKHLIGLSSSENRLEQRAQRQWALNTTEKMNTKIRKDLRSKNSSCFPSHCCCCCRRVSFVFFLMHKSQSSSRFRL